MSLPTPDLRTLEKVAETVINYYRQLDEWVPTAEEIAQWFDALPAPLRLQMHTYGLRRCLTLPSFRRYVLEGRGYSMPAYMAAHLTPHELLHWVDDGDGGVLR